VQTLQKYTQRSNDARNGAAKLLLSDFLPEHIPARIGNRGSSLPAWEPMALHLEVKRTHAVTGPAGFDTLTSSPAEGQFMLDGRQLNNHSIERVGLGDILSFGPSKVAKIKAAAGVSLPCESEVQVTATAISAIQPPFPISGAANDSRWKAAA
jgi:hypothetical protein